MMMTSPEAATSDAFANRFDDALNPLDLVFLRVLDNARTVRMYVQQGYR